MQKVKEVLTSYTDENNYRHIDAYFTYGDEQGRTVAIVCEDTGKVFFLENAYNADPLVTGAIEEAVKGIRQGRRPVKLLAVRDDGQRTTVATVTCWADNEDHGWVVAAIKAAVAEWATTEVGKGAIEATCDDFNFGDLAEWYTDKELTACLDRRGVRGMKVETEDSPYSVDYDEILCPY